MAIKQKISKAQALGMLERMQLIRRLEERTSELFADGEIKGFVHLSICRPSSNVRVAFRPSCREGLAICWARTGSR